VGFVAIDVETANADLASICQVGLAIYEDGRLSEEWKSYVDPEDDFDAMNVSIHGIDEAAVRGAPTFKTLSARLHSHLDGKIAVCHTHFDRTAVHQASDRHAVRPPDSTWLDSALVVRRAWEDLAWKGYGLGNVCKKLGYEFVHHDALEDAKAAGHVLLAAIQKTGIDVEGWLERVRQPIEGNKPASDARAGRADGPLFGEVLVFTGSLSMRRREAVDLASAVGCRVATSVSKATTILVVGNQDIRKLAGHKRSSKHRRAEALIKEGVPIKILKEDDFRRMVDDIGSDYPSPS